MKLSQISEIQQHSPTNGMLRHSASGSIWVGSINPQPKKKTKKKTRIKNK